VKKNRYSRTYAHLSHSVPHERNHIRSTEYLERIKSSSLVGKPKGKIHKKAQFYIIKVLIFHGGKGKKITVKGKVFVAFGYSSQRIYYRLLLCSLLFSLFSCLKLQA